MEPGEITGNLLPRMPKKRILSGMQPSGKAHLGNYLGAMQHHINFTKEPSHECFYFIANYHALTTLHDGAALRDRTRELAMDYLALGLDPDKAAFFMHSDVPEVTELAWILNTVTPMGLLERSHAWKDAKQNGCKSESVGLFNYPVLMAADILIYQSEIVPVGQDQKQHVEISRDIAKTFNNLYGDTFIIPEPYIKKDVATVPGTDGQKMSKSYGNTIEIFAPGDILKKQIFSIKTDSAGVSEPKDPSRCLPFIIMAHFIGEAERISLAADLKAGGIGYADLKKQLLDVLLGYFGEARMRRQELEKKPDFVRDVLAEGAKKARKIAIKTMEDVRRKTGLGLQ